MPEDSTEYLVDQYLKPLIRDVREKAFMPDYRAGISDYDVLGLIVSKYCRWDFNNLKEVMLSALEDSNFRAEYQTVEKMQDGGILNKTITFKELFK